MSDNGGDGGDGGMFKVTGEADQELSKAVMQAVIQVVHMMAHEAPREDARKNMAIVISSALQALLVMMLAMGKPDVPPEKVVKMMSRQLGMNLSAACQMAAIIQRAGGQGGTLH